LVRRTAAQRAIGLVMQPPRPPRLARRQRGRNAEMKTGTEASKGQHQQQHKAACTYNERSAEAARTPRAARHSLARARGPKWSQRTRARGCPRRASLKVPSDMSWSTAPDCKSHHKRVVHHPCTSRTAAYPRRLFLYTAERRRWCECRDQTGDGRNEACLPRHPGLPSVGHEAGVSFNGWRLQRKAANADLDLAARCHTASTPPTSPPSHPLAFPNAQHLPRFFPGHRSNIGPPLSTGRLDTTAPGDAEPHSWYSRPALAADGLFRDATHSSPILLLVGLVQVRRLGVGGAGAVGVGQQRANGDQNRADRVDGRPVVLDQVHAQGAVRVDVRVELQSVGARVSRRGWRVSQPAWRRVVACAPGLRALHQKVSGNHGQAGGMR